jgi:hypothetical protein
MWESSRELAVAVKSLKIKKGQQEPGQHSSATFSHEFLYYKKIFIYFLSLSAINFCGLNIFTTAGQHDGHHHSPLFFFKLPASVYTQSQKEKTVLVFIFFQLEEKMWASQKIEKKKEKASPYFLLFKSSTRAGWHSAAPGLLLGCWPSSLLQLSRF